MDRNYFVYILTNQRHTVLYIGVTSDLVKRVYEHKIKAVKGFTEKYNVDKLVYYEMTGDVESAIKCEKNMKEWKREWKENRINEMNPEWKDLYSDICC